jgi:hypothetical protein
VRALATVTFIYESRQDRVLAALNAGRADAWSCWLTRRVALALLERAREFLASTSALARQAPADFRSDFIAFEREAAIAKTAGAMSNTPPDVLKTNLANADLAERLSISQHGDRFRLEVHGQGDEGAAGLLTRAELQRILEMLHAQVAKAGWLGVPSKPQTAPAPPAPDVKPVRH